MTIAAFDIRPLQLADLPTLMHIQRACYGDQMVEDETLYARRLATPGQCMRLLARRDRGLAYLAAYHSHRGRVTPLHGDFSQVQAPDTLYLHDMAVHPDYAGLGMASRLLHHLCDEARQAGLKHAALVSVQGSQSYWEHHGFQASTLTDAQAVAALESYGPGAVYMVQSLAH